LLAYWSSHALLAFANSSTGPTAISADLDWRVLAFTIGAALLTGILFGLAPALGSMRIDLTPALRSGPNRGHGRASRFKLGNLLVVSQVALTMVVLVGAGVLSVSYSQSALLSGSLGITSFHLPGTPPKASVSADYLPIGPGFF